MMFMSPISCSYEFASKDVNATERSFVNPTKVVLVEPEPIDVEPSVGAAYEASGDPPINSPPALSGVMSVSIVPWMVNPFLTLKFLSDT
jgi:hypothetical protein